MGCWPGVPAPRGPCQRHAGATVLTSGYRERHRAVSSPDLCRVVPRSPAEPSAAGTASAGFPRAAPAPSTTGSPPAPRWGSATQPPSSADAESLPAKSRQPPARSGLPAKPLTPCQLCQPGAHRTPTLVPAEMRLGAASMEPQPTAGSARAGQRVIFSHHPGWQESRRARPGCRGGGREGAARGHHQPTSVRPSVPASASQRRASSGLPRTRGRCRHHSPPPQGSDASAQLQPCPLHLLLILTSSSGQGRRHAAPQGLAALRVSEHR